MNHPLKAISSCLLISVLLVGCTLNQDDANQLIGGDEAVESNAEKAIRTGHASVASQSEIVTALTHEIDHSRTR